MERGARTVVWTPSGDPGWDLEPATALECASVPGGVRTLYEVAAALVASGHDVELRGAFSPRDLAEVCDSAGAWPQLPAGRRPFAPSDTVITAEGIADPELHAGPVLSPARIVLLLLGPPGLIGWPFTETWARPHPLTVDPGMVARPEHFRAAAQLGYELWTNAPEMQRHAEAAGVSCSFIGNGVPGGYPSPPGRKEIDVLWLADNRWAPFARRAAARLTAHGVGCVRAADTGHRELLELFGRAKIVLHPQRIEGYSRIACEARAMGAVPVVLSSNPFGVGLDEAGGTLAVDAVSEIPAAVLQLLHTPDRLQALSARGMRTAREQVDWARFMTRVAGALTAGADDAARGARAAIGAALQRRESALRAQLEAAAVERDAVRSDLERHRDWLVATQASLSWRATAPLRASKRALRGSRP